MDSDGNMYADEKMFALMAQYMNANRFFDTPDYIINQGDAPDSIFDHPDQLPIDLQYCFLPVNVVESPQLTMTYAVETGDIDKIKFVISTPDAGAHHNLLFASTEPFVVSEYNSYGGTTTYIAGQEATTSDGRTYYYRAISTGGGAYSCDKLPIQTISPYYWLDISKLLCFGTTTEEGLPEGVHQFDTVPEGITDQLSIADILDLLRDQYPELFDNSLKLGTIQPDGTIEDRYYLPIGFPDGGTDTQPTSNPANKDAIDPKNEGQTSRLPQVMTPTDGTTKTGSGGDTGTGTTPTLVPPTGTASALYAIYNPTVAQVQALGAWLWSPNFVDQLLKVFSNPMEAIISLHKIYGTPHTAANPQNIKVGYLDSGVSSKVVDEQYITIDCGSVNVYEHYANIFDYSPFTELSLYLPFIGIVPVDVADVMRGKVKVIYHIDVITGAVLAEVHVTRDNGAGGVIYQYTGSCAEHYPLSAGSYMGIVTGAAGIIAGVAGTIASGGALAPMLIGGAASIGSMHTNVQKSGSFSANAGAMGIKKPYFIISRPQAAMSNMWQRYGGMGANTYCTLDSCKGFTRVKYIHLENISGATKEDLTAIESILKEGVIV